MDLADVVNHLGPWGVLLVLSGVVSVSAVLLGNILLLQGRLRASLVVPLALGLPMLVAILAGVSAPDEPQAGFACRVAPRFILPLVVAPSVVLQLGFSAFLGARRSPRTLATAALFGLLGVALAALTLALGVAEGEIYPLFRAPVYGVMAMFLVAGSLGSEAPSSPSLRAGLLAGVAFAVAVAAGEISGDSLGLLMLAEFGQAVNAEKLDLFLDHSMQEVVLLLRTPQSLLAAGGFLLATASALRLLLADRSGAPLALLSVVVLGTLVPALFAVGIASQETLAALLRM